MRATVMYGAGDIRVEDVPDARIVEPTDALLSVTRACICGSDLWPYRTMAQAESGRQVGHEAVGVVDAVGRDVRTLKEGDLVVMPFAFSDGTCVFCHEGLQTSCVHGGFFGSGEPGLGAQAEAVRVALLGTPEFSDVRIEEEEPCRKTTFPARWPKRTTEEFPRAP